MKKFCCVYGYILCSVSKTVNFKILFNLIYFSTDGARRLA